MKLSLKSIALIFVLSSIGSMSLMQANADKENTDNQQTVAMSHAALAETDKPYTGATQGGPDIVTYVDTPTEFDGYAASPDGVIAKYQWDFDGDGQADYDSADNGMTVHTFSKPGKYDAMFKAFDATGAEMPLSVVRVIVRKGKGVPGYLNKNNLNLSNEEKVKKDKDDFKKQMKLTAEEENFLEMNTDIATAPIDAGAGTTLTEMPTQNAALPADGIKKTYVVMINGGGESRFWDDVTYSYDMFHTSYSLPASNIYLLNSNGLNPSGLNPNSMIDYAATKANLQTVLGSLALIIDGDDVLYFWATNHGNGYIGPVQREASQLKKIGYSGTGRISVDPGAEQDYVESDFLLRSFMVGGAYEDVFGMDTWGTYYYALSSTRIAYYRQKYVSHFSDVNFVDQGVKSDNDIYIERYMDYLKGDTNRDGIIDTALGETADYDADGVKPFDPITRTYDEDDWGEIDTYSDNIRTINTGVPEEFTYTYTILDIGLDNRLDIDLNHDPLNPHANGTDLDNDGLIDGLDVNNDGDQGDWISIDEVICLYGETLADDELRSYLQPTNAQSVVIMLMPCFSGGFIEDLSRPGTIIMTSTEEETVSWGNRFIRNITSALTGNSYPDTAGNPALIDTNADGYKDMTEIFNFAAANDYGTSFQIPQYDDNGDGISHAFPIPSGDESALGAIVHLNPVLPSAGTIKINKDAAYTSSTSVTLNLTAIAAMTQMQFSEDGTTFSALEPVAAAKIWTLSAGDGTKKVCVRFANAQGVTSDAYSDTIIFDSTPATVYAPQTTSPTGNLKPVWNWQPAVDNGSGTTGIYKFYLGTTSGGHEIVNGQSVSATTYTHSTNLSKGTYYAYITTTDNAGNLATSTVGSVVIRDAIAPATAVTSPTNNATVSRNKIMTIKANATDAVGVTKVVFYVNGAIVCTDTTAAYTCSWKVPIKSGAVYTLQTKAYDAAGNIGSSAIVKVTAR